MSGDTERVEIVTRREHRVVETATLTLLEFCDEIHLEDLRNFVQLTALLPGDAQVLTRANGIEITYVTTDTKTDDAAEESGGPTVSRVPSGNAMDDPSRDPALAVRAGAVENFAAARTSEQRERRPALLNHADSTAAPLDKSAPTAPGESIPVEEVRRVVELIKRDTGWSVRAVAEMIEIPPSSLTSLMAPSWKYATARRSTYDKLSRLLDELAAEGTDAAGDAATQAVS